jgi:hypothetical protein
LRRGRRFGPDPEQQRRQAIAGELLHLVAARLLGEARLRGAFPVDEGRLSSFLTAIDAELRNDEHVVLSGDDAFNPPRSDYKVVVRDPEPGSISLICHYGSHSLSARLRIDGVLDQQGYGMGISFDDPDRQIPLSPHEQEVARLALERMGAESQGSGQGAFLGSEFHRAIAVQPQPGAAIQILAVEFYGDGVVVQHSFDDPVDVEPRLPMHFYEVAGAEPPIEEMLVEARAEGGNLRPNVSLSDDLGTTYVLSSSSDGGVQVVHGEVRFAPAVPTEAVRLVISTYAGSVTVDL